MDWLRAEHTYRHGGRCQPSLLCFRLGCLPVVEPPKSVDGACGVRPCGSFPLPPFAPPVAADRLVSSRVVAKFGRRASRCSCSLLARANRSEVERVDDCTQRRVQCCDWRLGWLAGCAGRLVVAMRPLQPPSHSTHSDEDEHDARVCLRWTTRGRANSDKPHTATASRRPASRLITCGAAISGRRPITCLRVMEHGGAHHARVDRDGDMEGSRATRMRRPRPRPLPPASRSSCLAVCLSRCWTRSIAAERIEVARQQRRGPEVMAQRVVRSRSDIPQQICNSITPHPSL